MKLDKPFDNAFHLLGAIGSGKLGFRVGGSMDHVTRQEAKSITTPNHLLKTMGQTNPMEDGSEPTMRIKRAIVARDCALRRSNPKHPEKIDRFILGVMACAMENNDEKSPENKLSLFVRKEALAAHLEVPEHFVAQSFERLNKLGILGPERNSGASDTNRGGMMAGSLSGWSGSIRYVNMEKLVSYLDSMPRENAKSTIKP